MKHKLHGHEVLTPTQEQFNSVINIAKEIGCQHRVIGDYYLYHGNKSSIHFWEDGTVTYGSIDTELETKFEIVDYNEFLSIVGKIKKRLPKSVTGMDADQLSRYNKNLLATTKALQTVGGDVEFILSTHIHFIDALSRNGVEINYTIVKGK